MYYALIASIVVAVLSVLIGAILFSRRRSVRALVRSIGIAVIVIGAYFFGLAQLLTEGVIALFQWIQRTAWTQQMTNASIAIGVGIIIVVVAGFLSAGTQPAARAGRKAGEAEGGPARPALPQKTASAKKAPDPEDAEIEALLKARGID